MQDLDVEEKPRIWVLNKVDLLDASTDANVLEPPDGTVAVRTSAITGVGLERLLSTIEATVQRVTSVRQGKGTGWVRSDQTWAGR